MLKKTTKTKPPSFANQLLLKKLEIDGMNVVAELTGDNPTEALDKIVLTRNYIHGPNKSKINKYSDAFTNGVLNPGYWIDDEQERSRNEVRGFGVRLTDESSEADLAIASSISFGVGATNYFGEQMILTANDPKLAKSFNAEISPRLRPNIFKTIGEFIVDHKQPNGLSPDTTQRVRSAASVYKLLDELIKLYEDSTITNTKSRNASMQKLLSEAFAIVENDQLNNENKIAMILAKSRSVLNNENKNVGKFSLTGLFHNKLSTQHSGSTSFASTLQSIISTHDPHEKALRRMYIEMNQLSTAQDSTLANEKMLALHKEFINYVKTHHLDSNPEYKQSIVIFNNLYRKAHEHISTTRLQEEDDDVVILPKPNPEQRKTSKQADDDVTFVHPKDTKYPIIEKNKSMIISELQKLRDADLLSPKTKTTISAIIKCLKSNPVNEQQFEAIIQGACKRRNIMQKKGLITKDVGKQFTKVVNALNELHNEEMSPKKFDSILRHEFKHLKETRLDAQNLTSRSRLRY